jgi:hypothetical protein
MADTLASQRLTGLVYEDVTTLFGIPAGTAITIQNQTTSEVYLAISATQPSPDFKGVLIPSRLEALANIPTGENQVWLKGVGPVNVQEAV